MQIKDENKELLIKFFLKTEEDLISSTIEELFFRQKKWLQTFNEEDKKKFKKIILNVKNQSEIYPGLIGCSCLITNYDKYSKVIKINRLISSFFKEIILKMLTVESTSVSLGEIPIDEIFTGKIDYFRLKEEILYSINRMKKLSLNGFIQFFKIDNVSVINQSFKLSNQQRKSFNDLILNTLNNSEIFNKSKLKSNNDIFEYIFQLIISKRKIIILLEFKKKLYQNLVFNRYLKKHPTTLSPHLANFMIFITLKTIQQYLNLEKTEELFHDLIIIDPFCGFGTIPLSFLASSDFFLSIFEKNNISLIKSIQFIGLDKEEKAISNSMENQNLILKGIEKRYIGLDNVNEKKIPEISFKKMDIKTAFDILPNKFLEKNKKSIIFMITQPPYGFTLKIEESKLIQIYNGLFQLAEIIFKNFNGILTLITSRVDLVKDRLTQDDEKGNFSFNIEKEYQILKKKGIYKIFIIKGKNSKD